MTDLVDELANELRHYRHSDMASSALAEHILAIPRIHDAQATIEALSERIAALDAECERAWEAYRIAHDQAMSNGEALANLRASHPGPVAMTDELIDTLAEALEVLGDCRRYLTEFGSVEPSQLVFRINGILTTLKRQSDEQCYLWQLATVNASRVKDGEQPLTYSEFMAGGGE